MVRSMERRFLLIKRWAGVANASAGVFLYSSKLIYGSLLSPPWLSLRNALQCAHTFQPRPRRGTPNDVTEIPFLGKTSKFLSRELGAIVRY